MKRKYSATNGKGTPLPSDQLRSQSNQKQIRKERERYSEYKNGRLSRSRSSEQSSSAEDDSDEINIVLPKKQAKGSSQKTPLAGKSFENEDGSFPDITSSGRALRPMRGSKLKVMHLILSLYFCVLYLFSARIRACIAT